MCIIQKLVYRAFFSAKLVKILDIIDKMVKFSTWYLKIFYFACILFMVDERKGIERDVSLPCK